MPIYEYRCDSCGHEFETIQKVSEEPLQTCPECAMNALRKKVSAAGFRLKGGGWYETDFKSGSKKNVSGADAASDSGGSGSKESDAKQPSSGGSEGKAKESAGSSKAAASE